MQVDCTGSSPVQLHGHNEQRRLNFAKQFTRDLPVARKHVIQKGRRMGAQWEPSSLPQCRCCTAGPCSWEGIESSTKPPLPVQSETTIATAAFAILRSPTSALERDGVVGSPRGFRTKNKIPLGDWLGTVEARYRMLELKRLGGFGPVAAPVHGEMGVSTALGSAVLNAAGVVSVSALFAGKVSRMLARVTTRRHGMREEGTLKLVRSRVVSRVTYSLPYQRLTKAESYGQRNWPPNTLDVRRLSPAETCCGALGIWAPFEISLKNNLFHQTSKLPTRLPPYPVIWLLNSIMIDGRPESRLYGKSSQIRRAQDMYYTGNRNKAVATVVNHRLREITSASIHCSSITEAEETAIALDIAIGNHQRRSLDILTDSQAACRNILNRRVGRAAISVLRGAQIPTTLLTHETLSSGTG
ncbi:hypothetical protein HPB52_022294 [Rhipicephalus sanguineus]|uniref:Tick transposon n=1 Tax=Rhipicephalus sanguineus TaxID=34632 RepID=A0A9D4TBY9_RHISA|nr:hypothetical protein HPB52_022294 [Rhipicephalus sanguineus]